MHYANVYVRTVGDGKYKCVSPVKNTDDAIVFGTRITI